MATGNTTALTMLDAGYTGTLYLALFTSAPTAAGGGTEVSGGSYARQPVTFALAAMVSTTPTKLSNNAQTFPTPTADWGTVTHWAFMSAVTAGTLKHTASLAVARAIGVGVVASASAGDFGVTLS